jgi:hypothetical protein
VLNNKYVIAIIIPLVLLLANAVVRKIGQGQPWKIDYFYLGAELSLTALGASMLYVYDLTRPESSGGQKIAATAIFMVVCLFLLLVVSLFIRTMNIKHITRRAKSFGLAWCRTLLGSPSLFPLRCW